MSQWIPVRDALPEEGAPVQFSFNERTLVLRGVFRFGAFTSRWSRYLPVEICSWRRLEGEGAMAAESPHRFAFESDEHEDDIEMFEKASRKSDDAEIAAFASKQLPVLQEHRSAALDIEKALKGK